MNYKVIGFGIATLSLIISSCSSGFKRPESIEDKMVRFKAKNLGMNSTPAYRAANIKFKAQGRGPASLGTPAKDKGSNLSNKKLYFLSLHNQYQQLKQYVDGDTAPQLTVCPRFHTSLVGYKESYGQSPYKSKSYSPRFQVSSLKNDEYAFKYPELFLPVSTEASTPTVRDILINNSKQEDIVEQTITSAMQIHLSKVYGELNELCEYGSSDNYYTYENLMTHIQRKEGLKPTSSNMTILLKTTLVGNMALIKSLTEQSRAKASRGIASVQVFEEAQYDDEVLSRMEANWSKDYFNSMVGTR